MAIDPAFLLDVVRSATRSVVHAVRRVIWSENYMEAPGVRRHVDADDHHAAPLLDRLAHETLATELVARIRDFCMITEEVPGHVLVAGAGDKDLCFIADPLDGSANARHRIPLASSSLCAYSRHLNRPVASAVSDVFLGITYYTACDLESAYIDVDGKACRLRTSGCADLRRASCAALAAQPERFRALASQAGLLAQVRWILGNCGAIEICRVASGDLDLAVEFAKGFRMWDLAAACHILERAGGVCRSPAGEPLVWNLSSPDRRVRFIAAATDELCAQAQREIRW